MQSYLQKPQKNDMKNKRISVAFIILVLITFYFKEVESKGFGGKGKGKGKGGKASGDTSTNRNNTSQDRDSNNPSTGTTVGSTNTNATRSNTVAANAGFIIVGSVESHPNSPKHDKPFQAEDPSLRNKTSSWLSRVFSSVYNKLFGSKKMVEKKQVRESNPSRLRTAYSDIDTTIEADDKLVPANPASS